MKEMKALKVNKKLSIEDKLHSLPKKGES